MKTVHIMGKGAAEILEVAEPEPVENKVVVKIESSLICGTKKGQYLGERCHTGQHGQAYDPKRADDPG